MESTNSEMIEEWLNKKRDDESQLIIIDGGICGTGKTEEAMDALKAVRTRNESQRGYTQRVQEALAEKVHEPTKCPCDRTDYDWYVIGFGGRAELMCSECLWKDLGAVGSRPFKEVIPVSEAALNGGDSQENEGGSGC